MEPICIPANSAVYKTGALMLIGAALPLGDAIFLMRIGAMQTNFAVAIVFMFVMGCYGMIAGMTDLLKWHRAKTTPALLLTEEGITDSTGTLTGGLVHWSEVQSVSKVWMTDHYSLAIQLTDNKAYLARLPGWKRFLLSPNIALHGTPFLVSQSELAMSVDQAKAIIESAYPRSIQTSVAETSPPPVAHWWTAIPPEERGVVPLRSQR